MTNESVERVDILIEQILAEPGVESRWREFTAAAHADPALWRRLAELQRDQAMLEQAMEKQVSVADSVELPDVVVSTLDAPRQGVIARIGSWGGWAVAAMVALAWGIFASSSPTSTPRLVDDGRASGANPTPVQYVSDSPEKMRQAWMERGQEDGSVLMEMPTKTLIDSRQLPDGRIEVLFIRHVLERSDVQSLYEFGHPDEQGNFPLVPRQPSGRGGV